MIKPTCVSMGKWNSGLAERAVLLGQLGDVGQVGFADEHARAGKLFGELKVSLKARNSCITGWVPGRLLVRVSFKSDVAVIVAVRTCRPYPEQHVLVAASRGLQRGW